MRKTARKTARKAIQAYNTLRPAAVLRGRKTLAKLQRQQKEFGFIAKFARDNGVTDTAASLALRGRTYQHLPFAVKPPRKRA